AAAAAGRRLPAGAGRDPGAAPVDRRLGTVHHHGLPVRLEVPVEGAVPLSPRAGCRSAVAGRPPL
ncbi:MAG: hypothetical protein AVDCRST_MAG48-3744, partial [uncultured Friedmanniella sp.]